MCAHYVKYDTAQPHFRPTGLKILSRVDTHISFIFFWKNSIILYTLIGISPFKLHKSIFFQKT